MGTGDKEENTDFENTDYEPWNTENIGHVNRRQRMVQNARLGGTGKGNTKHGDVGRSQRAWGHGAREVGSVPTASTGQLNVGCDAHGHRDTGQRK